MKARTPAQWHNLFAEQKVNGLSVTAFCREHTLCSKNFGRRRKELQLNTDTPAPPSFIPVTVKKENNDNGPKGLYFNRHSKFGETPNHRYYSGNFGAEYLFGWKKGKKTGDTK